MRGARATAFVALTCGALLAACFHRGAEDEASCTGASCTPPSTGAPAATPTEGADRGAPQDGGTYLGVDAPLTNVCPGVDLSQAAKRAVTTGTLIAAGVAQRVALSSDGVMWGQDRYVPPDLDAAATAHDLISIAVGTSGLMVAASTTGIMTSQDGLAWTEQALPEVVQYVRYDNGFNAAAFGKGVYVVAASARFNRQAFYHSTDGVTWPAPFVPATPDCCRPINAITFADDKFVAVGSGLRSIVSDDGVSWHDDKQGAPDDKKSYDAVAFGNGVWVAVGSPSIFAWSTNGIDWTDVSSPFAVGDFRAVAFDGTKFVTCARSACYSSADGKMWKVAPGSLLTDPRPTIAIRWQDGVFVGLDVPATVLTSADGLTWRPVYCGATPQLRTLAFKP